MRNRAFLVLSIVWLVLAGGCARLPEIGTTPLRPESLAKLQSHLLTAKADFEQFKLRGPFTVRVKEDELVSISATERIEVDLYLSSPAEKAPLVVLLHGHDNSKDDHAYQAMHLATWGMHSMTVQLPNNGPWTRNGQTLARLLDAIQRAPQSIDPRIDAKRLVLVGHSFGGFAVIVALGERAPAIGGILLDPAGLGKSLPGHLKKIGTPVMVIASDPTLSTTRNRGEFYEFIRTNVAEVSITGAQHDDAQFPLETPLFGRDSSATLEMQVTFAAALTSTAFSLGFTGKLDYAWASFGDAIRNGKLSDALRK